MQGITSKYIGCTEWMKNLIKKTKKVVANCIFSQIESTEIKVIKQGTPPNTYFGTDRHQNDVALQPFLSKRYS